MNGDATSKNKLFSQLVSIVTVQSAIFFNTKTKDREEGNSRIPSKRKRDELTPSILVDQTSTSTLFGEENNETTHCSRQLGSFEKNEEQIALKLNVIKDKAVRFFSRCIAEEFVPKGLKLELEPTIGYYDQEFIDKWYSKLKTFSPTLMNDIVAHCDKTIVKTQDNIKDTETHLKNLTEREEYQCIEKPIKNNEANTKQLLQQRKSKKFNYLKNKQNSTTKETPQPVKHKTGFQKTYASVVQSTNNTNTNVSTTEKFSNTNAENESQTLLNKLKTLNPNKRPQSRGKSPSRSTSKTRQEPSPRDKEIENLKNEIQILKQSQTNSITGDNPKNALMASTPVGSTTNNTEIINVLTFIQQTMETLSAYNEQLKAKLDINLTHQDTL